MINFIICEDETILANQYEKEIDKFMMNYNVDYKINKFKGYDNKWQMLAKKDDGFKIYLLDIKTNKGSGIDAARKIREEYDDWSSMIIMITAHQEYKYEALGKRLMLVDFINKLDSCEKNLQEALLICMKNYDKRDKCLKYTYKTIIYNIEFKHIVYIEKEQDSKRCIITTTYGVFYIPGTLKSVKEKLDKRFIEGNKGTLINTDQIKTYNKKTNVLTFKNNDKINSISRSKKKEVENYARGIY